MIGLGGCSFETWWATAPGLPRSQDRDSLRDTTLTFGQSFPLLSPGVGVWF